MPSAHPSKIKKRTHNKQPAFRPHKSSAAKSPPLKPPTSKPLPANPPTANPTSAMTPTTTVPTTTRVATSPHPPPKRPPPDHLSSAPAAKKPRTSPPTMVSQPTTTTTTNTPAPHPSLLLPVPIADLHTTQILSSTKMSTKITSMIGSLRHFDFADRAAKPVVVMAWSRARTAGKLVSIVEVVKREVAKGGGVWFQYNALGEGVGEVPRGSDALDNGDGDRDDEDGGEEDDEMSFEMMKTKIEREVDGTDKKRSYPIMTIYLSRVRIEALREAYGEQTNSKR